MFIFSLTAAAAIVLTVVIIAVMTNVDRLEVNGGMVHFVIAILVLTLIGAIILAVWFGFITALDWLVLNYSVSTSFVCALTFAGAVIRQIRKSSSRRNLTNSL
jgi:hypothetical protein